MAKLPCVDLWGKWRSSPNYNKGKHGFSAEVHINPMSREKGQRQALGRCGPDCGRISGNSLTQAVEVNPLSISKT